MRHYGKRRLKRYWYRMCFYCGLMLKSTIQRLLGCLHQGDYAAKIREDLCVKLSYGAESIQQAFRNEEATGGGAGSTFDECA